MFHFHLMVNLPSFLTFITLIIPTIQAYEYHAPYCGSNTTTYLPNSSYQTNLRQLLDSLYTSAAQNNIFMNTTIGHDPPNIAYGLYLCRGDIIPNDCRNCVQTVSENIVIQCPNQKEAVIWYDNCMLRYSNRSIFGFTEVSPVKHDCNKVNITEPGRFQQLMIKTMNGLATQASTNIQESVKAFATKEVRFNSSHLLYGLVQCTPDLSDVDCDRCLRINIDRLPQYCSGRQGARVLTPSCNVRYEVYPFYYIYSSTSTFPREKKKISSRQIAAIVSSICAFLVLSGFGCSFLIEKARRRHFASKKSKNHEVGTEITKEQSLHFDLDTVEAATNFFSPGLKIGEGGFGAVYKGVLSNGQEIAVKRLSRSSGQGAQEFKNEAVVMAKLQHRNLVRLLGFCLEKEEKILIYEYVPNHSLDYFLFDPIKQRQLDWSRRYKIIGGIARGILYLHEDSRLRIIHRDLKAANILLDEDMNPKISDFGTARIFGVNQTQASTNRIIGTFGYMSPEYAMHGQVSTKLDVFSFGVLVLEIISGKKNNSFYQKDGAEDLLCFAWKQWREGTPMVLIDPNLVESCSRPEVIRCINIGLLCVQEHVDERPSMASVVLMLSSDSITLPLPQKPPYFNCSRSESMMSKALDSDKSISNSMPWSVDQLSVTELDPHYLQKLRNPKSSLFPYLFDVTIDRK